MNKKKIIAALLASACITTGAFGLTACGDAGADGKSAYEIAVANGFTGTEAQWLESLKGDDGNDGTGTNGKSAYEIAVANGFTGTEAEWLASLKGSQGQPGQTGGQGNKGDTGVSIVSAKQITDKWGIVSYFEFTLSDGSKIDTSATPIITVDADKEYLAKDAAEKLQLLGYGVRSEKITVRDFKSIKTYSETVYLDNVSNLMSDIYIYEIPKDKENDSTSVSLSEVIQYGGAVDLSGVDLTAAGKYTITGIYRGESFEIPVTIEERTIVNISAAVAVPLERINNVDGTPADFLEEIINEQSGWGNEKPHYTYGARLAYDKGWSKEVPLKELKDDGATFDTTGIEFSTTEAGVYPVSGSYKGVNFVLNILVTDNNYEAPQQVLTVLSNEYYVGYVGTSEDDIFGEIWCTVYYKSGNSHTEKLRNLGVESLGVDLTTAGEKTVSFTYEDVECSIKFTLLQDEVMYTLTGTDTTSLMAYKDKPVTSIKLYKSGKAELFSGETCVLTATESYMEDGFLTVMDEATQTYLNFKYDLTNEAAPTFANITEADAHESEMTEVGTFTGTVEGKSVSAKLYINSGIGVAGYTVDEKTYVLIYIPVSENVIMIPGIGMFTLDTENHTMTAVTTGGNP